MLQTNKNLFNQLKSNTEDRLKSTHFGRIALHFEFMMLVFIFIVIYLLPSLLFEVKFPSFVIQTALILSIVVGMIALFYIFYLMILQLRLNRKPMILYVSLLYIFTWVCYLVISILGIDYYFAMNWINI